MMNLNDDMKDIEFGSCLFKFSASDAKLSLHSRDIQGVDRMHFFPLDGAFLFHLGGGIWRFVTGVGENTEARHLFDDFGESVDSRVEALRALGVPVLSREEGKQNLEQYRLPVKRLILSA